MGATPKHALPYPAHDDPPSGFTQIQALAEAVDDALAHGIRSSDSAVTAASQTTTSGSYVSLGTPDKVTVECDETGLLVVYYEALVINSATTAGAASLHINGSETPHLTSAAIVPNAGGGFVYSQASNNPLGYGTALSGGLWVNPISAGSYELEVKYKRTSGAGNVTPQDRKLYALILQFGLPA